MTTVIKRDGSKEPFDPDKVRRAVEKAAVDAGLALQRRKEVIEKVTEKTIRAVRKKGEIATSALREQILEHLDAVERRVSDAWRRFDQRYKER